MSELRWECSHPRAHWYTAYKRDGLGIIITQYRIWRASDGCFHISEETPRHIGEADTFDQAQAIAQTHADQSREEPAEVA
jgi:hypothetical protein